VGAVPEEERSKWKILKKAEQQQKVRDFEAGRKLIFEE
jgi:hypothetical protein